MALKFQFNKTALQQLKKELKVRTNALPTLQAKEAALRVEVKKAKAEVAEAKKAFAERLNELSTINRLWTEFPDAILKVKNIDFNFKKIAGVNTPILNGIEFTVANFSLVSSPAWFPGGLTVLKGAVELQIRIDVAKKKLDILEYARKKTTQKVNLYEKVQIPEYEAALLKIKRFMEDEENLQKSSQKILKARMAAAEVAA